MNPQQIQAIARRITYKPGWKLVLRPVTCELMEFRWEFMAPCAVTGGGPNIQICAVHIINPEWFQSEKDVMKEMLRAVVRAETHEAQEWLKLDGVAPFYPH